jgi:hypothetical protein
LTSREHTLSLPLPPQEASSVVDEAAEAWGAELEPEGSTRRILLPILAGLRRGVVRGTVAVEPAGTGSRVVLREDERLDSVHAPSLMVLLLAVLGAALVVLWPFYPQLLPVAPFGALMALGGWFLVISRLRSSGPEEFLKTVEAISQVPEEDDDSGE